MINITRMLEVALKSIFRTHLRKLVSFEQLIKKSPTPETKGCFEVIAKRSVISTTGQEHFYYTPSPGTINRDKCAKETCIYYHIFIL